MSVVACIKPSLNDWKQNENKTKKRVFVKHHKFKNKKKKHYKRNIQGHLQSHTVIDSVVFPNAVIFNLELHSKSVVYKTCGNPLY